jgi:hypothetical protein
VGHLFILTSVQYVPVVCTESFSNCAKGRPRRRDVEDFHEFFLSFLNMPGMNAHDAGSAGESSGDTRTAQQIIDATRAQLSWMEAAESEVRSSF